MSGEAPPEIGCGRVRGRLERLLDGGLPPLEEALDSGHLEACPRCRRERAQWEELRVEIRRASAADAADLRLESERIARAVLARLARPAAGRMRPRISERLASTLIGAAVVLALFGLHSSGVGLARAPHVEDFASLDQFLGRLPSWSDVLEGLSSLSRHLSYS